MQSRCGTKRAGSTTNKKSVVKQSAALPCSNNRKEELVGNKDSIDDMALRFVCFKFLHALYLIFCLLDQFTTGSEVKSDGVLGSEF